MGTAGVPNRLVRVGRLLAALVAVLLVGALLGIGGLRAIHKLHFSPPPSVAQPSAGYGLDAPTSAAAVGSDLFIANESGDSVTELNASSGAHVATISGASFAFNEPTAILGIGPDLFVANGAGGAITEFVASTRSLVRVISGLSDPVAMAASGGYLYVLNGTGSVAKVSMASGGQVGLASGPQFGFDAPRGIAASGGNLFVTDSAANAITEINAQTMTLVTNLTGTRYRFSKPTGVVVDGPDLWVTNQTGDSVTEIATSSHRVVRVVLDHTNLPTPGPVTSGAGYVFTLSPPGDSPMVSQITPGNGIVTWMMCNTNGPYLFSNPQAVVVAGSNLWVVNKGSSSLTEMDSDSGALIRTIS